MPRLISHFYPTSIWQFLPTLIWHFEAISIDSQFNFTTLTNFHFIFLQGFNVTICTQINFTILPTWDFIKVFISENIPDLESGGQDHLFFFSRRAEQKISPNNFCTRSCFSRGQSCHDFPWKSKLWGENESEKFKN